MVMEFLKGKTVMHRIEEEGSIPAIEAVQISPNARAKPSNYVHKEGLLHRDIKPDNLMLTNNDETGLMNSVQRERLRQARPNT